MDRDGRAGGGVVGRAGVGAFFARKVYRENAAHPVWVPIPVREDADMERVGREVDRLEEELSKDEVLEGVSADLGLIEELELPDDRACAAVLRQRLFVRVGDAETRMGPVPAIHVGMKGKNKERELTTRIVERLMEDVWGILGIQPPS